MSAEQLFYNTEVILFYGTYRKLAHTDSSPGGRLPPYLYITRRKTQGIPISHGGIPSYSILISNY